MTILSWEMTIWAKENTLTMSSAEALVFYYHMIQEFK